MRLATIIWLLTAMLFAGGCGGATSIDTLPEPSCEDTCPTGTTKISIEDINGTCEADGSYLPGPAQQDQSGHCIGSGTCQAVCLYPECSPGQNSIVIADEFRCEDAQISLCHDIDCSGHGECIVDNDAPQCLCDPGYVPDGIYCEAEQGYTCGDFCAMEQQCYGYGKYPTQEACVEDCEERLTQDQIDCALQTECPLFGQCAVELGALGPILEELLAMTFNLRTSSAWDEWDSWTFRREMVANVIAQEMPAVMGVQEALKIQLDFIQNSFPGYEWVGVSRKNSTRDEFSAIFFRTDMFELRDTDTFWLSDTPDEPLSRFTESQRHPRIVTWAKLKSLASGRSLFVFNTHFNTSYDVSPDDYIPERSAALMVRQIRTIAGDTPVIVTGDFNNYVGSAAYRILTGDMEYDGELGNLIDPWVVLDLPEGGTHHSFTGIPTGPSRIDWVFATEDFLPLAGEILYYNEDGRYPSDHFPVTATYLWTESPEAEPSSWSE